MTSEDSGTGAMADDLGVALGHAWAWFSLHEQLSRPVDQDL